MRIAFASSNGKTVDSHFGQAEAFYLWDVGPEFANEVGRVLLRPDAEEREDKILARADALSGCAMVYSVQIGGPAAAKLVGRHIQPMKTSKDTSVSEAITKLQTVLRDNPPPWLKKALQLDQPVSTTE